MSNIISQPNNSLSMWEDATQLEEIRSIFAPTLTPMEFKTFVGMGKATGLNPFLKEIWAVKYGKDREGNDLPAQIFIGRDGYRKGAHRSPEYDYHLVDAVYENDTYEVRNGEVNHVYNLKNRGKLIGAYCLVKLRESTKAHYVFVELEEYSTGQGLWAEISYKDNKYGGKYKIGGKRATMIKKVAEVQGLRMALDIFEGTYSEYEINSQMENNNGRIIEGETQTERLKNILNSHATNEPVTLDSNGNLVDESIIPVTVSYKTGEVYLKEEVKEEEILASSAQVSEIKKLMDEKEFDEKRRNDVLNHYKIASIHELSPSEAEECIHFLNQSRKI